jgi:subtilisin family serine protease
MAAPEAPTRRYYYANGKRIAIEPSTRFMTVRAAARGAAPLATEITAALAAESRTAPPMVMTIPQYDIALIAIDGNGAGASGVARANADAVRSKFRAQGSTLAEGPPVFELADMPRDSVVIPVGEVIVQFRGDVGTSQREQVLKKYKPVSVEADDAVPGRFLLRTAKEEDSIDVANALEENDLVDYAEPNLVTVAPRPDATDVRTADGVRATLLDVPPEALPGVGEVLHIAEEQPRELLEEAQPASSEAAGPAATPNDPGLAQQWGLRKIRAIEAWSIHRGNAGIVVAVLDEGCDIAHEDIAYALPGYDAWSNDNDPTPNGNDAHGTACAGIIAMRHNNGRGGVGVAPGCRILPVRIAQGIGGGFWSTSATIVDRGIRTAVLRGASVLSNSYSLAPSTTVTRAFEFAQTNGRGGRGCLIAAASGNGNVRDIIFPAELSPTIPGMLAVGASNEWDQRKSTTSADGENWWGSNYGPELDVVAPGVHIFTSDMSGGAGYATGNYVSNFNGTSSATPHVAGLAGLILSVDPSLRSWEVEEIIKMTARDLGARGRDEEFGFGRIDARLALEAATRVWSHVAVRPVFLGTGQECFMRMHVRIYNSGINRVRLNNVVVRSHTPDWSAEVDRFEYTPNPGGIMLPRSGNDVTFPRILLMANGNRSSWSYRYSVSWAYTFWRPTAPGLPLSTMAEADGGTEARIEGLRGSDSGGPREATQSRNDIAAGPLPANRNSDAAATATGDSVTIDRETRSITIVIR